MLNWADRLIPEYTKHRLDLKKRADQVNRSNPVEVNDLKQINSMIESMSFSMEWMETGKQPGTFRGIDEKAVYQRRSYENIDLIPDIERELREANDINKKKLELTKEEKVILSDILSSFSLRERQCYILHEGQGMSWAEIAEELMISKSTVQTHITRARKKVHKRIRVVN